LGEGKKGGHINRRVLRKIRKKKIGVRNKPREEKPGDRKTQGRTEYGRNNPGDAGEEGTKTGDGRVEEHP